MKSLIPFKIIDKYKYIYFVINSAICAIACVLLYEIMNELYDQPSNFALKYLSYKFFFTWGFMYPLSFIAYEKLKKRNKKLQEEQNNKQEDKV